MAVFGAPVAHEDDAERAVRAGLRILEAIEELNRGDEKLQVQVRVGINTGEALVALGRPPRARRRLGCRRRRQHCLTLAGNRAGHWGGGVGAHVPPDRASVHVCSPDRHALDGHVAERLLWAFADFRGDAHSPSLVRVGEPSHPWFAARRDPLRPRFQALIGPVRSSSSRRTPHHAG
jgi:hypothetical protein